MDAFLEIILNWCLLGGDFLLKEVDAWIRGSWLERDQKSKLGMV